MTYDLLVVGAGILGTAHALQAAEKGLKVLLLEKDNFPVGSTVRNFGQVVPSGMAGKWFDYGRTSLRKYAAIQEKAAIGIQQNGSIYIASDADEWLLANELYDHHQRTTGYACTLLSKKQCLDKYPTLKSDYVQGGLFFPDEISAEPHVLIHRLIDFCKEALNVDYQANTTVCSCEETGKTVTVTTTSGVTYQAANVLVCCGYTFNILYPTLFMESGLVVSKLQMLQTHVMKTVKLQGNILTGLTIRRYESFEALPSFGNIKTPEHYLELKKWGIHILFKQALDGSIIIGDSHEYAPVGKTDELGFDTKEMIDELILQEAERIVDFSVRKIARKWAGFYAQHPNEIYQHSVSKNIHICTGIGGKGMTSSLGFAEASIQHFL
jgi:D-hydroxyproline dehydrogenase subunit beta